MLVNQGLEDVALEGARKASGENIRIYLTSDDCRCDLSKSSNVPS